MLPLLVKQGFEGEVYCTKETADLTRLILDDAAFLSHNSEIAKATERIVFVVPGDGTPCSKHELVTGLDVEMYSTGHILGAMSFRICWQNGSEEKSITFSGDVGSAVPGREHLPLLKSWQSPPHSDYAVVESTYGARARPNDHKNSNARLARLGQVVDRAVLERRGTLIIPCFAIDRTQSVLFDLSILYAQKPGKYCDVPVYFDAPLASKVNALYGQSLGWEINEVIGRTDRCRNGLPRGTVKRIHTVLGSDYEPRHKAQRASLASGSIQPAILITGGGMCEGGRVMTYLENLLLDEKTTVLFTGYISPATVGGAILKIRSVPLEERSDLDGEVSFEVRANGGAARKIVIPYSDVKARIEMIDGYSGHADRDDLLEWCFPVFGGERRIVGRRIFIVHGDIGARRGLREALDERSRCLCDNGEIAETPCVTLPNDQKQWFDLDGSDWEDACSEATNIAPVVSLDEWPTGTTCG